MWIAQDRCGDIYKYSKEPYISEGQKQWFGHHSHSHESSGYKNKNWQYSLINLETHDYKIEDGILVRVDRVKKPAPRKHAELACKYFMDDTINIQLKIGNDWIDNPKPMFEDSGEYRIKPKTSTVTFRNYLSADGCVRAFNSGDALDAPYDSYEWICDWQEVEVPTK